MASAKQLALVEPSQSNKIDFQDRAFHDWYRFVLSFPPHLVRSYLEAFDLDDRQVVVDPFCGTGTTLVEAKLNQVQSIGFEANPFPYFASSVKVDWNIDPDLLLQNAYAIATTVIRTLEQQGIDDQIPFDGDVNRLPLLKLNAKAEKLLIRDSISALPLHKSLVLLEALRQHRDQPFYAHTLLALANVLVFTASNLRFGPEVGIGKLKSDAPVIAPWLAHVERMAGDLRSTAHQSFPSAQVYLADARQAASFIPAHSVDAVITSPPYPNEKDYTRTTRLESVVLGFINDLAELRGSKKRLVRSNTRVVYKGDDDDQWIRSNVEVQRIANEIEARRLELGKTSGFEKLYGKVTRLYFGGMARHLAEFRRILKPGARLAYVVGDQASYLQVMIRTGQLLSEIAESLGYEHVRTDLFRTRFATATKEQLREEVVVLRWTGSE